MTTHMPNRRQFLASTSAAIATGLMGCATTQAAASVPRLRLIGEARLPHKLPFQGTTVGGLSGIDFDPASGVYYLISDDRSSINPARFYTARIPLSTDKLGDVELLGVTTLRQADGSPYPAHLLGRQVPDPEAIRWHAPSQTLLWTTEGNAITLAQPALRQILPDGTHLRDFALPAMFDFSLLTGPRINKTLEGLALTPDGRYAWIAMEAALRQDGPEPTPQAPGGPCRFTQIDIATGKAVRQIAYVPDAIPRAAIPPSADADNGVAEVLMLDAHRMLVLERAYMAGYGPGNSTSLRLYLIDMRQGTDTLDLPALQPGSFKAADKTLLADFASFPALTQLDNTEGMTWGPTLPSGNRTLLFVSDNNFNPRQITQFLAFEFLQ